MSTQTTTTNASTSRVLSGRLGLTSRTALTAAMAGGVLAGGVVVGLGTLDGRVSGHALLLTSTALFLMGAAAGFVVGTILGLIGREPGVSLGDGARRVVTAALYAVLGLSVSWLVAIWVAMSAVAGYLGRPTATVLVAIAWIAAVVIVDRAARNAGRALKNAYRRWRDADFGLPRLRPASHG